MADSAPYFHDGGSKTLEAAIDRHHGDAEASLEAFKRAGDQERRGIVAFLRTLKAPTDAKPAPSPTAGTLATR